MKRLLIFLAILLCASSAFGATYYIDPTCTTSGTGTSQTCDAADGPFKTWAELSTGCGGSTCWAAGNTYSQKGGTTAYETVTVGASGTAGNVITLNSYGTGQAIIDGNVTVAADRWTGPDGSGVYYFTATTYYYLMENGIFLQHSSSKANLGTDGYVWTWSVSGDGKTYYKPTDGTFDTEKMDESRAYGIDIGSNDYITIDNLSMTRQLYGVWSTHSALGNSNTGITIKNCNFTNAKHGVWLKAYGANSSGITITNNTCSYLKSCIELSEYTDNNPAINEFQSIEISHNTITNCSEVSGSSSAYYWDEIGTNLKSHNTNDLEGIGTQDLSGSDIHGNTISGVCRGIVMYAGAYNKSYNNNIYNNKITITEAAALSSYGLVFTPNVSSGGFYGNNIYNNLVISSDHGMIGSNPTGITTYNYVYNNTIRYGIHGGAYVGVYIGSAGVTNCDYWDFKNNIFYGAATDRVFVEIPAACTDYANLKFNNNLYFPASGALGVLRFKYDDVNKTFATWQALGLDGQSPDVADPAFVDAAGGNYNIAETSPAKWAGNSTLSTTALGGNTWHSPASIGAYEVIWYSTNTGSFY